MASKLIVTHLNHDLQARKSYVSLVWSEEPAKRLGLVVPFGTDLSDAETAARTALTALSRELDDSVFSPAGTVS
jgi:hypothetical protein